MGYESDFAIASAVGHEEEFIASIGPSLDECALINIATKNEALRFLSTKVFFFKFIFN